jgi:alpha-L-arabinofuranosidase
LNLQGLSFDREQVIETLKLPELYDFNSLADQEHIYPVSKQLAVTCKKINIALDPISVNVIILNIKR